MISVSKIFNRKVDKIPLLVSWHVVRDKESNPIRYGVYHHTKWEFIRKVNIVIETQIRNNIKMGIRENLV